MKKIFFTLGILLLIALIMTVPTKRLISQVPGQLDIARVIWKVLTEGILLPDLETSAVFYDDFFDLPDTTSGYDWDTFTNLATTGVMKLSDGKVYNLSGDIIKTGGGVLFLSGTQPTSQDTSIYNIQKTGSGVILTTTKNIEFEIEFLLSDSANIGAFMGFAYPDADSVRNYEATASIAFEKPFGAVAWHFRVDDGTSTTSKELAGFTADSDTGWNRIKFTTYDTNRVVATINGITDSIITTNIPHDSLLVLTIEVVAGTLYVGDITARQLTR